MHARFFYTHFGMRSIVLVMPLFVMLGLLLRLLTMILG